MAVLPQPPPIYNQSYENARNQQIERLLRQATGATGRKYVLPDSFVPLRILKDGYTQDDFQRFMLTIVGDIIGRGGLS